MSTGVTIELADTVLSVVKLLSANAKETDTQRQFPSANVEILAKNGLLGLIVPRQSGGIGASNEIFAGIAQDIGGACASTGMIFVMHCCGVDTIATHQPNLTQILEESARGQHLSTLACSERGTGANFYASNSTSTKAIDGFILSGEKAFVTSGGFADSYVVSTRAVDSTSPINTTLYLLKKDAPGLAFTGNWQGLGLRANNSVMMKFEDCLVPTADQIGQQGKGFDIEMGTILPRFLLGTAAVYNGIAKASLTASVDHVMSRSHSHTGEGLGALPVLRNKIGRMKVSVDSSVALMQSASRSWDTSGSADLISLLEAKQIACRTAADVTMLAMEACGGIAYSAALPVERHFRDAQAGLVMAPTSDMLLDLIGRATLGLPLM